jgi:hypothetical protein
MPDCASDVFDAPNPRPRKRHSRSVHLLDQFVDLVLSVAEVSALDEVLELPFLKPTSWAVQLEWPQEVGRLFEIGADGVNLMDQVLHANHAVLAEILFDDLVVSQWKTLLVDLAVSSLCTMR